MCRFCETVHVTALIPGSRTSSDVCKGHCLSIATRLTARATRNAGPGAAGTTDQARHDRPSHERNGPAREQALPAQDTATIRFRDVERDNDAVTMNLDRVIESGSGHARGRRPHGPFRRIRFANAECPEPARTNLGLELEDAFASLKGSDKAALSDRPTGRSDSMVYAFFMGTQQQDSLREFVTRGFPQSCFFNFNHAQRQGLQQSGRSLSDRGQRRVSQRITMFSAKVAGQHHSKQPSGFTMAALATRGGPFADVERCLRRRFRGCDLSARRAGRGCDGVPGHPHGSVARTMIRVCH